LAVYAARGLLLRKEGGWVRFEHSVGVFRHNTKVSALEPLLRRFYERGVKFDFAISFAGTDRDLARQLSDALRQNGFEVFFDELFEHEMLGRDGADYLSRVYFAEARCCIALISQAYDQRSWAQLERRSAQAREFSTEPGFLIPVLIDGYRPLWLLPTRIYFDLKTRTLSELVTLLIRRMVATLIEGFDKTAELVVPFVEGPRLSMHLRVTVDNESRGRRFIVWDQETPNSLHAFSKDEKEWRLIPLQANGAKQCALCTGDTLISFPESTEVIHLYDLNSNECQAYRVPRRGRYTSIYDFKLLGSQLLLAYCGGDCWLFDLNSRVFHRVCEGTDDATWTYADFDSDGNIVVGGDARGAAPLKVFCPSKSQLLRTLKSPISVNALSCSPTEGRVLIAGGTSVYAYAISLTSGEVDHRLELNSRGIEKLVCARSSPIAALISGDRHSSTLEVYSVATGIRLGRLKTGDAGEEWDECHDIAMSQDGQTIVAVRADKLIVFEKLGSA